MLFTLYLAAAPALAFASIELARRTRDATIPWATRLPLWVFGVIGALAPFVGGVAAALLLWREFGRPPRIAEPRDADG